MSKAKRCGHGLVVQKMISSQREVILGAAIKEGWGPLVMAGVGGVYAETLRRIAFRPIPIGRRDAEEILKECGAKVFLRPGGRGRRVTGRR
jgi:acetyltransferase